MIAVSAYPSSASSLFGSTPTKASRLHPLLAFVFAGVASTLATSTQAHYTIQTLADTATEQRTEQVQWCGNDSSPGRGSNPSCKLNLRSN